MWVQVFQGCAFAPTMGSTTPVGAADGESKQVEPVAVEEDAMCAVCFDDLAERFPLPCACRVDYCGKCWDKCLAESFKNTGMSRCPTCRMPICVNFDPEARKLVFTLERRGELRSPQELQEYHREAVARLLQQARSTQILLLREYGAANADLVRVAQGDADAVEQILPREALETEIQQFRTASFFDGEGRPRDDTSQRPAERLRIAAGMHWPELAIHLATGRIEGGLPRPPLACACGSALHRVTIRERISRWVESATGHARGTLGFRENLSRLMEVLRQTYDSGLVECDICNRKISRGHLWTCNTGTSTIMHSTSYDICDWCFLQHAFDVSEETVLAAGTTADDDG